MRCPLTSSAGNPLCMVSWVMGTAIRVKATAVVIPSVDATNLLMASEVSDVVGMKAVTQNVFAVASETHLACVSHATASHNDAELRIVGGICGPSRDGVNEGLRYVWSCSSQFFLLQGCIPPLLGMR